MMKRWNAVEKCIFTLIMASMVIIIVVPLLFFFTLSFMNSQETSEFPRKMFPTFNVQVEVEKLEDNGGYKIYLLQNGEKIPTITSKSPSYIQKYMINELSVKIDGEELVSEFSKMNVGEPQIYSFKKDLWHNFEMFFAITSRADKALMNSIQVVILTILISLSIGSLAGYAIARYKFRFKDQVSMMLLVVRMFPMVGISIPIAVILMKMQLFDTMLGLALLYSIPNIALTSWITSSIFIGISPELEEASLVFGANSFTTFMRITLPMALPALSASSLYAFLTAWNDTISALILTSKNQTLALAVYKAIGDSVGTIQYVAAGSIILILPAMVFVFILRKYVNQMWGGVSL